MSEERNLQLIKVRDPKADSGLQILLDNNTKRCYQLMKFQNDPSSVFVDDYVQKDGSLIFVTEIDPLFLVMYYLRQSDKYRPLDQILVDNELPDCKLLHSEHTESKLLLVANVKEIGDMKVYCYDSGKCRKWLINKVNALIVELSNQKIPVSNYGAQISTFVRDSSYKLNNDDYKKYAYEMICEYLSKDLVSKLYDYLELQSTDSEKDEIELLPPAKKPKLESQSQEPKEDYFDGRPLAKAALKIPKLTATQRAISKVDKTRIKPISSFFKKK
ncbi:Ribonuclease H2 subunit B [Chamberlinius hualienensis]